MHWLLRWPSVTAISIMIVLIVGMVLPALMPSPHKPGHDKYSHLKQIGLALKQYSIDYDDYFPDKPGCEGFNELITDDYLVDRICYHFREDKRPRATKDQLLSEENTSYAYIAAGLRDSKEDYDYPVAISKPWLTPEFLLVLYMDGHVSGFKVPELQSCTEAVAHLRKGGDPEIWEKLLANARIIDESEKRPLPASAP